MVADYAVPKESFLNIGTLNDTADINLNGFFVNYSKASLAMSRDLGSIQATQDPIVWAVGLITDPVLNYTDSSGATQQRSLYFKTQYGDDETLVGIHIHQRIICLISRLRLTTFSTISPMPLQEPSNSTYKYSRRLLLSLDSLETWCPSRPRKYMAALS